MSPEPTLLAVRLAPARLFATVTLPVMGIPVRFESGSPQVLAAVEASFGAWRVLERDPALVQAGAPVRVRIRVRRGGASDARARVVGHGVPRPYLLIVSGPAVRGYADALQREAVAEVDAALVDDTLLFRALVVEALALFLVTRMDREPLHAAAVVRGDAALVLAGRSGVGKSTTVYAAARAGLRVLAEDAVFLQLRPFRVWGMPAEVRLGPESARFFPELAHVAVTRMANGKEKRVVPLRGTPGASEWPLAERVGVCLLSRGGPPRVEPLSAEEMVSALADVPEPGFSHFAASIRPRVRLLAARGGWRLALPGDPADTVGMLHEMLDSVEMGTRVA
ncbi:MAG: hypothetical protein JO306_13210 [Gemmatimonadetes bacterium]|nr:hypothetical protein [Gemmatimonadota bacterium]